MSDNFVFITVIYGAHEGGKIERHQIHGANGRKLLDAMPYGANEIGVPRSVAKQAMRELANTGTYVNLMYWQYGEGKNTWYEEGIYCYIRKENHDKAAEVFSRYFSDSRPRYIVVDKAEYAAQQ